jgi:putative transposase
VKKDSNVIPLRQPEEVDDPLTAVLRSGARRLLVPAVEAEAGTFLASMQELRLPNGRARVVRHGHGPERLVQTGIGPVPVRRVKVRDRGAPSASERIRFTSALLPRWARRTRSLDALPPILSLRGVSMGDCQDALTALLGPAAPNLSPSVIGRLRDAWQAEYERWQRRHLSARQYVYLWADLWADGVYLQARMEPQAECMLVLIGATPEGRKELVGFQVGVRESAQSWRELLVDVKARGRAVAPPLATGDGSLGFWKALEEVFPATPHQRCWVQKAANVLDKLPKSVQPAARQDLREIWQAPDRATAAAAMETFAEKDAANYAKAVACMLKDREALLTFYDFPAEHWDHLRTSNPIESVFATVRLRTVRTKGALSQDTARRMVFKLVRAAAKTWRRLNGENQSPKVVRAVTFRNGVEVIDAPAKTAA